MEKSSAERGEEVLKEMTKKKESTLYAADLIKLKKYSSTSVATRLSKGENQTPIQPPSALNTAIFEHSKDNEKSPRLRKKM